MKVFLQLVTSCIIISICACNSTPGAVSTTATIPDTVSVKLELVSDSLIMPIETNIVAGQTDRLFITDYLGTIRIMKKDSLLPTPFLNLGSKRNIKNPESPVGTICSMAFHPAFASNGKFYVCYNAATTVAGHPGKLMVASFQVSSSNKDIADPASEKTVLELEGKNIVANSAHIAFGPDGFLYISIGEDGISDSNYVYHGQDLDRLNGKILRVDVDKQPYAIPVDNPFVSVKGARPEIWAYGIRKMWSFCFDPITKKLIGGDVGEQLEEELDIVEKGGNYGWPVKEGDAYFMKKDSPMTVVNIPPIHSYTRVIGICVIGGNFYEGKKLSSLVNQYVFSDFNGSVYSLQENAGQWSRESIKIVNRPVHPFFICGNGRDSNNEILVMGYLVIDGKNKGVVYWLVKG